MELFNSSFVLLEVKPGTGQGCCPSHAGTALAAEEVPKSRGFTGLVSFGEWRWQDLLI